MVLYPRVEEALISPYPLAVDRMGQAAVVQGFDSRVGLHAGFPSHKAREAASHARMIPQEFQVQLAWEPSSGLFAEEGSNGPVVVGAGALESFRVLGQVTLLVLGGPVGLREVHRPRIDPGVDLVEALEAIALGQVQQRTDLGKHAEVLQESECALELWEKRWTAHCLVEEAEANSFLGLAGKVNLAQCWERVLSSQRVI